MLNHWDYIADTRGIDPQNWLSRLPNMQRMQNVHADDDDVVTKVTDAIGAGIPIVVQGYDQLPEWKLLKPEPADFGSCGAYLRG